MCDAVFGLECVNQSKRGIWLLSAQVGDNQVAAFCFLESIQIIDGCRWRTDCANDCCLRPGEEDQRKLEADACEER